MLFIKVYISQLHQYSGTYSESISRALYKIRHTALTLEKLESKQMALSLLPPPPHSPSLSFADGWKTPMSFSEKTPQSPL